MSIGNVPLGVQYEFVPYPFSGLGPFAGMPAFAGYGVVSPENHYDDYANIDVKGRVVIALRYEPHDNATGKSRFSSEGFSSAATLTAKVRSAETRGAAALLLVTPPNHHRRDGALQPFVSEGGRFIEASIPVLSITARTADRILGLPISELQRAIDVWGRPVSYLQDTGPLISGNVDLEIERLATANVAAVLPGIGPHASEYVVVGAHYDHIGRGRFGSEALVANRIHNGADDNASGVAAILSVAQRLKDHRLERSILFVAFSAEEEGLLGSRAFVADPQVPLARIAAMINLDMVGRVREQTLWIGGAGTRRAFPRMLQQADDQSPLHLRGLGEGGLGPSDHESFAQKRIPVLFLTSGMHAQYHHPDDDTGLINFEGLDEAADLTADLVQRLAAAPREPYVDAYDGQPERIELTVPTATTRPTPK